MRSGRLAAVMLAVIAGWSPMTGAAQSRYGVLAQPPAVLPSTASSPWVGSAPAAPSYGGVQQSPYGTPTWGAPEPSTYGYATPDYGQPAYAPAPNTGYEQPAFNPYSAGQAAPAPMLPGGVDWGVATTERVTARAGGGTLFGDDVGLEGSDSWFQGFFPLFQTPGQTVTFMDTRALKFYENSEAYGLNLAAGYRWYSPGMNRVHGGYASYDYRNTGVFDFNQISFGAESLGRLWDVRANGYVVTGGDRFLLSTSDSFAGMNLVRTLNYFDAFSGFDGEIGRNLTPASPDLDLKVFAGGYRFTSDGPDNATGVRVRGEARFWDQVDVGVAFQHDAVFDTTFNVSIAFLLGGSGRSTTETEPNQAHRLDDPIHKNMHIVLGNVSERVVHLDPADGAPLTFLHANNNAAAGGDGSFEAPFQTLAETEAAASADGPDVVLLQNGSTFTGESITIDTEGQQLIGFAGVIESQFGTSGLPTTDGMAIDVPTIDAAPAPGAVIVAANDVEVHGITIDNATQHGIVANNVDGVKITLNAIRTAAGDGVSGTGLTNADISRNTIFQAGGSGVALAGTTSGAETAIVSNTITASAASGLEIASFADGTISSNRLLDNTNNGLLITNFSSGTLQGNNAERNLQNGFEITTLLDGTLAGNEAIANVGNGFVITTATGGALGIGSLAGERNVATGNDQDGFVLGTVSGGFTMQENLSQVNGDTGYRFGSVNGGTIDSNTSNANVGDGFSFVTINGGTIRDNSSTNNQGFGYRVLLMPGGSAPDNTGSGNASNDTLNMP